MEFLLVALELGSSGKYKVQTSAEIIITLLESTLQTTRLPHYLL